MRSAAIFACRPVSPAIGAGIVIEGVTEGHPGSTADAGAYPFQGEYWAPGHDFSRSVQAELRHSDLKCGSKLRNCGFETGEWSPWTAASGTPAIVFECAWDYSNYGYMSVTRSNKYAAMLGEGDRIEQVVSGLQPNATYSFWAGIRTGGYYRNAEKYDECRTSRHFDIAPGGSPGYRDAAYVGPLKEGDWLCYPGIDFGDVGKYNVFDAGLTRIRGPLLLEVRLDSPQGELIGTISVVSDYDNVLRYFSTPIHDAGSIHDLFLVMKGAGSCLLQSFKLYHSLHASSVRLSVHGHDGEPVSHSVRRLNWDARMDQLTFKTGPNGNSATVAIENTGEHYVYAGRLRVAEPEAVTMPFR